MAISGIQVSRRVSRLPYVELHNQGKVCVAFILGELSRKLVGVIMRAELVTFKDTYILLVYKSVYYRFYETALIVLIHSPVDFFFHSIGS